MNVWLRMQCCIAGLQLTCFGLSRCRSGSLCAQLSLPDFNKDCSFIRSICMIAKLKDE